MSPIYAADAAIGGRSQRTLRVPQLYQSYVGLMLVAPDNHGSRSVPVTRYGAFEVRLVELAERGAQDDVDVWVELYCRDTRMSLDSCRCRDLDEAQSIADGFARCAERLSQSACERS